MNAEFLVDSFSPLMEYGIVAWSTVKPSVFSHV